MFKIINDNSNIRDLSTTVIYDNVNIIDFLTKQSQPSEIILCPVQAIDIDKREIFQDKCISCGICLRKAKKHINFDKVYNKELFIDFCRKEKLFVYRWLSLVLTNYSGTNIKSKGFSRIKRIPLMIVEKNVVYLIKASHTSKDIESAYYELQDIVALSNDELKPMEIKTNIVIIDFNEDDRFFLNKFPDITFLFLEKILENLLIDGKTNFNDHITLSRC